MTLAAPPSAYLGPVTEARFAQAFASSAIVTASTAADLIGVDVKTLGALTDRGAIRSVPKGQFRGYTEMALRTYLLEGPAVECAPTVPKPRARPQRDLKVVNFSERRRRKG